MEIGILNKNTTRYFTLKGDFTITSLQDFQDSVFPALQEQEKIETIGIDMSGVNFIDSSGIGKLVQMVNLTKQKGITFYLISLQDRVLQLFRSVRLDRFFPIIDKESFTDKHMV